MKGSNAASETQFMGAFGWSGDQVGLGFGFSGRRDRVDAQLSLIHEQGLSRNLPIQTSATILKYILHYL